MTTERPAPHASSGDNADPEPPAAVDPEPHHALADEIRGDAEQLAAKVKAGLAKRTGRMVAGFVVIAVGIALLPIPVMGPAWLLILFGLALLPFAWAQRATRFIRRHIPGIPEDGRIPTKTWIIMGAIIVVFVTLTAVFGPKLVELVKGWF